MGPGLDGVGQAALAFADPANHAQLIEWHEQGVSFTDMIDRLGLAGGFDPALRAVIDGLSAEEVTVIREAMVAELDRVGPAGSAELPVDCVIDTVPAAVAVTPIRVDGRPFAHVTPA